MDKARSVLGAPLGATLERWLADFRSIWSIETAFQ